MKIFFKLIVVFIVLGIIACICSILLGLLTVGILEKVLVSIHLQEDALLIVAVLYQFPMMFIVWIIAQIAAISGARGQRIYAIILNAIFFTSIAIALFSYKFGWGDEDSMMAFFTGMVATVSAILAALLFRSYLKEI